MDKKPKRKFAIDVSWQGVATIALMLSEFLLSLAMARILGIDKFGLYAFLLASATVLFHLFEIRVHEPLLKFASDYRQLKQTGKQISIIKLALAADFATGVLAFVVGVVVLPYAISSVRGEGISSALVFGALTVVAAKNVGNATARALFRFFNEFRSLAFATIIGSLIRFAIPVVAVSLGEHSVAKALLFVAISTLISTFILLALSARVTIQNLRLAKEGRNETLSRNEINNIVRFTRHGYFYSLALTPSRELDVALLGLLVNDAYVGLYKVAKNFLQAIEGPMTPIYLVTYTHLADLVAADSKAKIYSFIRRLTWMLAAVSVIGVIVAYYLAPHVIPWLMGANYKGSVPLFDILIVAVPFWVPLVWVAPYCSVSGRPDINALAATLSAVIAVPLFAFASHRFGPMGAAWSQVTYTLLVTYITVIIMMSRGLYRIRNIAYSKSLLD